MAFLTMAQRQEQIRASRPQRKQRAAAKPKTQRIVWEDDRDVCEGRVVKRINHNQFEVKRSDGSTVYIDRRYVKLLPSDHVIDRSPKPLASVSAETVALRNADRIRAIKFSAQRNELEKLAQYGGDTSRDLEQFGNDVADRYEEMWKQSALK